MASRKWHFRIILSVIGVSLLTSAMPASARLNEPMTVARQNRARLLDTLYAHRALQDQLMPVTDSGYVNITVQLVVSMVLGLDEVKQVVEIYGVVVVGWEDKDLGWEPEDFGGLENISLPSDKIWHPTMMVVNSGSHDAYWIPKPPAIQLYANGTAYYVIEAFLKVICSLELTYYPLDRQECHIVLSPSMLMEERVRIARADFYPSYREVEYKNAQVIREWIMEKSSWILGELNGHPVMDCMVVLKRRTLYYVVFLLVPMFVTAFMTNFVFLIPPNSGERISFLVSVFLASVVLLNFIGETTPRTIDSTPRLLLFLLTVIFEGILAIICSVFVIKRHERERKEAETLALWSGHRKDGAETCNGKCSHISKSREGIARFPLTKCHWENLNNFDSHKANFEVINFEDINSAVYANIDVIKTRGESSKTCDKFPQNVTASTVSPKDKERRNGNKKWNTFRTRHDENNEGMKRTCYIKASTWDKIFFGFFNCLLAVICFCLMYF